MRSKYVAYIGSYSYTGSAKGITICDVDMEKGRFIKRTEIEVNNSSYVAVSRDEKAEHQKYSRNERLPLGGG